MDGATSAGHASNLDADSSWQSLVDAANCPSLLVVIESRLGSAMRSQLQPEDILQEALLHAWKGRAAARFESPRAFRAWLLTIIDHRIRDAVDRATAIKRGGGDAARGVDLGAGDELFGSTTPSRVAVQREQAAAMNEALQGVPPEWRDVVLLRLFRQMTLQQICDQLGLTLAVVRTRLRRGAEVYRQRLRAAGIGRSTIGTAAPSAFHGTDPASVV